MSRTRRDGWSPAVVVVVLLGAGAAELLAYTLAALSQPTAQSVLGANAPHAFLPVALAVALTGGTRFTRIAGLAGAFVALVARALFLGLSFLPAFRFAELPVSSLLLQLAGVGLGLGVFVAALVRVLKHRDLSVASPHGAPAAPAQHSAVAPTAPISPTGPARPSSPATPVDAPRAQAQRSGAWATAGTPWPRANEDDPNGTLIRPPRR